MSKLEKITFRPEGEEPVEFYVLEQTRIGGHNYILVTDVDRSKLMGFLEEPDCLKLCNV